MSGHDVGESSHTLYEFPPLDPVLSEFIDIEPLRVSLTSSDISIAESVLVELENIRRRLYERADKAAKVQPVSIAPLSFAMLDRGGQHDYLTYQAIYNEMMYRKAEFIRRVDSLISDLVLFVNAGMRNSVLATCKCTKFYEWMQSELKRLNLGGIHKCLKARDRELRTAVRKREERCEETGLRRACRSCERLVNLELDWVERNGFEERLYAYCRLKGIVKSFDKIAEKLESGDDSFLLHCVGSVAKKIDIKCAEHTCLLHHGLSRLVFDWRYCRGSWASHDVDQSTFQAKCALISSFSPRALGLSERLFTARQMDTPMVALVRENKEIREISGVLSCLHFRTCPHDILYTVQSALMRLSDLVESNEIERKLGEFAGMVKDGRKKGKPQMMSFDDCFSLFFSILAIDPPCNALSICAWLDHMPELSSVAPRSYAKATFLSAVSHISQFSKEQIVAPSLEESTALDPLGIL